ncbi:MAG: nicotinamide mononucleotide transporter family protein, partial [Muribaculaceae bacterium]|nr:nicotinamide mononucleotide transporter family protein [Muribaculaceae bacterium]
SIVGTWLLARKYLGQWFAWIAVDAVSTGLYMYKGMYFYSALYGIYTVIAVWGYFKWKRIMTEEAAALASRGQ